MKFTKMHGCGNDYVYVDVTKVPLEDPVGVAIKVSDRHFGIGSDGLILIAPSEVADFRMEMYNLDGSRGAMCGNGIRCVGKYVYDHGLTDKEEVAIETDSGIKILKLTVENGKVAAVRVNMGAPILEAGDIPIINDAHHYVTIDSRVINAPIYVDGREYEMTGVSMGNPHCVIFVDEDPMDIPLEQIGPKFENHSRFPERINTEFVLVKDKHRVNMRVWERGSGETLACGTGTCATAVAGILTKRVESPVVVEVRGGEITIEWAGEGEPVYMTGPATEVFEGEINL
ncbi:MAG: diaminopimelate epimerase [Lachnospiraceae bacterium]|nr:diaminopimelate epimerase [Candidatus Equihabitans merdae]